MSGRETAASPEEKHATHHDYTVRAPRALRRGCAASPAHSLGSPRPRNGSNFGLTGGVGFNFGDAGGTQTFVEVGAVTVLTGASNSAWFPVRFGIRF